MLVDGGFLDLATREQLGEPATSDREELLGSVRANPACFQDWQTAVSEFAAILSCERTETLEAAIRESFVETGEGVVEVVPPEVVADLLAVFRGRDFEARARSVAIPTLLIACGQPPDGRAFREEAWTALANASPLIEVVVVERWSHVPMLQEPEAFSELVGAWLTARLSGRAL